jgi:phosphatidylglycerol:prolipoprotein diacylglycerol transferase
MPPSTAGYLRSVGDTIPANIPDSAIVAVHPTQLYETTITLILCALLWKLGMRLLKPGQLFALFMGLYAVERFLIEVFRAKGDRFIFGLSTAQGLSVLLAIAAVIVWQRQRLEPEWVPGAA